MSDPYNPLKELLEFVVIMLLGIIGIVLGYLFILGLAWLFKGVII